MPILHQTFQPQDLLLLAVLVLLEGLLSIDNALVLGLLARTLPRAWQSKALTYGLIGSFIFRLVAVAAAAWLIQWRIVKLLGGLYLLYVAVKHFWKHSPPKHRVQSPDMTATFWKVVASIELTDIAFAIDSILAGIALVGPAPAGSVIHPKLWVIVTGGMLGVLLMRVAAVGFIQLLKKFPRFEISAYLLVGVVGLKLLADWWFNADYERLDFGNPAAGAFWGFWGVMLLCGAFGFLPRRGAVSIPAPPT